MGVDAVSSSGMVVSSFSEIALLYLCFRKGWSEEEFRLKERENLLESLALFGERQNTPLP
jgi:hypothetical protein